MKKVIFEEPKCRYDVKIVFVENHRSMCLTIEVELSKQNPIFNKLINYTNGKR
jgi:hypothetical protein